jgi:hypothetical protein
LKFVSGPYLDLLFEELQKLDGRGASAKSSTKRDDQADALGLCQQLFCPAPIYREKQVDKSETAEFEEQAEKEMLKRAHYSRLFGNNNYVPPPPQIEEPQQPIRPQDPRLTKIFGGRGPWRM